MNDQTALLVQAAAFRVRSALLDGQAPAFIGIDTDPPIWLEDFTYWRGPHIFEMEAGQLALEHAADRVVFAVPLITLITDDGAFVFRPVDGEVDDEEVQQIWIVTLDLNDGLDVHRTVYRTAHDGLLAFESIETFNGDATLEEGAPGWQLIQAVITT